MARKFLSTGTLTLSSSGANTVIAAPAAGLEVFIRRLYLERVDTTDVTAILKNDAETPREIGPRITLNADAGKIYFEFDDDTEIGCGDGKAFVIDASVANKIKVYAEYQISASTPWPA